MIYIMLVVTFAILFMLKTENDYDPKYKDRMTDYIITRYIYKDGTALNKNGSLTRVYRYKCDDMDHQTNHMLFLYRHMLNDILKRFDEKFVINFDSIRRPVKEYPDSKFEEPILKEMDNSRKKDYISGKYYESENYLSITYFPPNDKENKIKSFFITSVSENYTEEIINKFTEESETILNLLREHFLILEQLTADETITFLHTCITGEDRFVKHIPGEYMDNYLSDKDMINDFDNIRIGNKYLKVIGILSHVDQHECGMFDEISRLGISYRWSNRFIYLSDEKAIKLSKDYGRAANNQKKEFMEQMADRALKEQVLNESSYAEELKEQAQNLADDTKKKIFANGYYTFNIVLMEEDQKLLKENVKLVMKTINDRGFQAVSETVNCFESFCGTILGYFNGENDYYRSEDMFIGLLYTNIKTPITETIYFYTDFESTILSNKLGLGIRKNIFFFDNIDLSFKLMSDYVFGYKDRDKKIYTHLDEDDPTIKVETEISNTTEYGITLKSFYDFKYKSCGITFEYKF